MGNLSEDDKKGLKNLKLFWELVNLIDRICEDFLRKGLPADEIISALSKVTWLWEVRTIKNRFGLNEK